MTREEAIDLLDDIKFSSSDYPRDVEALEMAIEALEQIKAIESIINVSNLTIQEDVLKYKMIVDIVKGDDK